MAIISGRIKAISVSKQKGMKKSNVPAAQLQVDYGIIGDAHAGNWHRQVSLLAFESFAEMTAKGISVSPGDFAENITTEGIDLRLLKPGDKLRLGVDAEIEITQSGKRCHRRCEIFKQIGDCIMPRQGSFAKVTKGGCINVGDAIEVMVRQAHHLKSSRVSPERSRRINDQNGGIDNK